MCVFRYWLYIIGRDIGRGLISSIVERIIPTLVFQSLN